MYCTRPILLTSYPLYNSKLSVPHGQVSGNLVGYDEASGTHGFGIGGGPTQFHHDSRVDRDGTDECKSVPQLNLSGQSTIDVWWRNIGCFHEDLQLNSVYLGEIPILGFTSKCTGMLLQCNR